MKRVAMLVTLALAVVVPTAQAQTTIIEPMGSHHPYQRWIDESHIATPSVTVLLTEWPDAEAAAEQCGADAYGCEACREVSNSPCPSGRELGLVIGSGEDRRVFFHEIGHTWDEEGDLQQWQRERFLDTLGQAARQWYIPENEKSPNEWFAEAYSLCATLPTIPPRATYFLFGEGALLPGGMLRRMCWQLGRRSF